MPKNIFKDFRRRRKLKNVKEWTSKISHAKDDVLQFLAASCLSRLSQQEYERFLSAHDFGFERDVEELWNYNRNKFSVLYFCNICGRRMMQSDNCCGEIVKFVRIGVLSQLKELVEEHISSILAIRKSLRLGSAHNHNISAPFFSPIWKSERKHELRISGLLSIDGVSVSGNNKKIWPLSIVLLDLKTSDMQKSSNVMLEGLAECDSNPSPIFWNSIHSLLMHDLEGGKFEIRGYDCCLKIVTSLSDQPAKRALFGMRGHNSAFSCFWCLSNGTFYKGEGLARSESRSGELTLEDAENGRNGFSDVPANFLKCVLPYETPLDILHNCGEGLYQLIIKEVLGETNKTKSDLFSCTVPNIKILLSQVQLPSNMGNIHNLRNGTDKISFFQLVLGLCAICTDCWSPEARLVIVSLSLITNRMYINGSIDPEFDEILTACCRWFLKKASISYFSCKAHELLFHLPYVSRTFGNTAPLSTFCFEASYQYILKGFSTKMTRGFCETVCSRVLLANSIKRELKKRSENNPGPRLRKFLSSTSGYFSASSSCRNMITSLKEDEPYLTEAIFIHLNKGTLYSSISLPFGTLRSRYYCKDTTNDVIFTRDSIGRMKLYRFIAVVSKPDITNLLVEPLIQMPTSARFPSLRRAVESLTGSDYDHGCKVLKIMDSYDGLAFCLHSKKREIINVNSVSSVASYFICHDKLCVLAVNGVPIHN
ncbi:unnamed protein product [Caenorhabditis nigoni]